MKIALCQMENKGSVQENLEGSLRAVREAASQHADLILFSGGSVTEFFPQYPGKDVSRYRVRIDSEIVKAFCDVAREHQIMVVPNLYLEEHGKAYDASLLIRKDGTIAGVQKMVHVAQADKFFEQDYYTPADDGFKVFETEFGKIGLVICFDRHYPESIRTEALMGADLILIPTVNTKAERLKCLSGSSGCRHSTTACLSPCAIVSGWKEKWIFRESIIVDANGNTVLKADDREQILYADIDLAQSCEIRGRRPYTNLRRKELYV